MTKTKSKILVVDDDRDVLSSANMVLKQRFTEVLTLENPKDIPAIVK